jgi:hypothetical protein
MTHFGVGAFRGVLRVKDLRRTALDLSNLLAGGSGGHRAPVFAYHVGLVGVKAAASGASKDFGNGRDRVTEGSALHREDETALLAQG